MRGNPFAGLSKALEVLDDGLRDDAGGCSRCGRPRGGIVPAGKTRANVGICSCAVTAPVQGEK